MITGPNWKPREYSQEELAAIRRRKYGTTEELCAVLCDAISKMTPEEKAEIRAGMRKWADNELIQRKPVTEVIQ